MQMIVLSLCGSIVKLQKMLDICNEFGIEYGFKFNSLKSSCVLFRENVNPFCLDLYLLVVIYLIVRKVELIIKIRIIYLPLIISLKIEINISINYICQLITLSQLTLTILYIANLITNYK